MKYLFSTKKSSAVACFGDFYDFWDVFVVEKLVHIYFYDV